MLRITLTLTWACLALLLLKPVLLIGPASADDSILIINTFSRPPLSTESQNGPVDKAIREAFRRAGKEIRIVHRPEKRSIHLVEQGKEDGLFPRVKEVFEKSKNMVAVPVPFYRAQYVAWNFRHDNPVEHWDDLQSLWVAYPANWKVFELYQDQFGQTSTAVSIEALFRMAEENRIDVSLYERGALLLEATEDQRKRLRISPPLATHDLLLGLNKKHEALVPLLSQAFTNMMLDGTMADLCPPCAESLR